MPDLEPPIAAWREAMRAAFRHQPEIVDELEDHLRATITALLAEGVPADEAMARAARHVGAPQAVAEQFQKLQSAPSPMKTIRFDLIFRTAATVVLGAFLLIAGYSFLKLAPDLARFARPSSLIPSGVAATYYQQILQTLFAGTIYGGLIWLMWRRPKAGSRLAKGRLAAKVASVLLGVYLVGLLVGVVVISVRHGLQGFWKIASLRLMICVVGFFVLLVIWPWRSPRSHPEPKLVR